jgi:hypothetical protein
MISIVGMQRVIENRYLSNLLDGTGNAFLLMVRRHGGQVDKPGTVLISVVGAAKGHR